VAIPDTLETLENLRKDGKIRAYGVSNETPWGVMRYLSFAEKNGWEKQPRVQLQVRKISGFKERHHNSWPIEGTEWTRFYLGSEEKNLSSIPPKNDSKITFSAVEEGVNFLSSPLESETEITGPSAVKLFVSSSTVDADLFVVLRIFSPAGKELVFQGAIDPYTPIGQGIP
jgi:predicted acyl esterase